MQELDYINMGKRIRQVRKAKGWSQDELAKKAGISMSFMGHIERGSRIMSLETFSGICSALGAGADELLWGVAHPSDSMLEMWQPSGRKREDASDRNKTGMQTADGSDSYSLYVRIMKSVAEIMNES